MAVTTAASGTQTAVIGTEHTLLSLAINQPGSYTLHVGTRNMAVGDTLELRIYQMMLAGDPNPLTNGDQVYFHAYQDVQDNSTDQLSRGKVSVPISNDLNDAAALVFTLKQTSGVGRAYKFKVLKYA